MKSNLLSILLVLFSCYCMNSQCPGSPPAGYTCIPDAQFEQYLVNRGWDSDGMVNGQVLTSDISSRTTVDTFGYNVADLTGIEDFAGLFYLTCANASLTSLDLSSNTNLLTLNCNNNSITTLNVSGCTILNFISCADNDLSTLDLSNKGNLEQVIATNNPNLNSIDLTDSNYLRVLRVNSTNISSLDLNSKTNLQYLECSGSNLSSISIGAAQNLYHVNLSDNQLTSLDLSSCGQPITGLTVLVNCDNNMLTELNIQNGDNMEIDVFSALNNDLSCITVDDVAYSTTNWTNIDPGVNFSTNCVLGIEEVDNLSVLLFPNPSKNDLNIQIASSANYTLIDLYGQKVLRGALVTGINVMDIQTLSNGMYFLNIDTGRGYLTYKVIKE